MPTTETPYEDLLAEVAAVGVAKGERTGTGTTSVFGRQIRFDLSEGFPLIWTKRVHWPSVAYELLWVPPRRSERALAAGPRPHHLE